MFVLWCSVLWSFHGNCCINSPPCNVCNNELKKNKCYANANWSRLKESWLQTHKCQLMRPNRRPRLWADLYPLCSPTSPTQTHTQFAEKPQNPNSAIPTTISRNAAGVKQKHPSTNRNALSPLPSLPSLPCLKPESKGWAPSASRPFLVGCRLRSITWWRRSLRQ